MKRFLLASGCAALCAVGSISIAWADNPPSIAVSGEAEIHVVPDRARLSVAVEIDADRPDAAADGAHEVARDFVRRLDTLGIAERRVRSTALQVSPRMRWDDKRRQQVRDGYRARRDVIVEIEDLALLGQVIDAAQRSGMTHVSPPELEASDADERQREALRLAGSKARDNARALAAGLGVELGNLLSASESQQSYRPPQPLAMRASADHAESAPDMALREGEIVFSARVDVRFAVAP